MADAQAPQAAASAADSGRIVYDQAFFSQYTLSNGEDMLRRVPGVAQLLDTAGANQQSRGFGSAGAQILIDGKRMAGKANDITAALRRISPANVERVELIRGTSEGLDVLSEGVVVNFVMKAGASASAGAGNFEVNGRFNDSGWSDVDGLVSYAGALGRLGYILSYERNATSPPNLGAVRWTDRTRDERYFYPSGAIRELRPQIWSRRHGKQNVTGNFTFDFANGDALRLNSFYQVLPIREIDTTNYTRFSTAGATTEIGKEVHVRDNGDGRTSLELGLEFEKKIGPGALKALALASRGDTPQLDFRNRFVGAASFEINRTVSEQDLAEDIVRLSYAWPIFDGQTVELGAESAKNTLDQGLRTFQDLNGDGRIEEVASPVAFAHVQEQRYEGFVNHTWAVTPKLSLESSFNVEFSKLSTNYPANPDRQYTYPKPRIDARYTLSDRDQIRFKVERTVSQLAFVNFVPVYNVLDNRIDAGNPNLQPEKIWTYEGRYEHRLGGDNGVLEARAFYKDIADHIDRIVIGQTAAGVLIPASGNIDKATVYGAEGKASVRLALIGWRDVLITARYLKQHSEVSDPFTGRTREAAGYRNWEFEFGFRHDITAWALSYGANTVAWAPTVASDLLSFDNYDVRPTLEAFVEKGLPHRLSLRFEAQNLTHAHEIRDRLQYAPNAITGAVSRIDYYNERRDMRFALRLRGKF